MSLTAFDSQVPREALSWLDQDALTVTGTRVMVLSGNSPGNPTGAAQAPASVEARLGQACPKHSVSARSSSWQACREHPCLRQETHRGPRAPTLTICPGISALSLRAQDDPRKRVSSVRTNLRIQPRGQQPQWHLRMPGEMTLVDAASTGPGGPGFSKPGVASGATDP
jgi:hypothetical protein